MMNEGISVADALALRNTGSNSGSNGWGDSGAWWIIILILFFAVGGWGRNGLSGGGSGDVSSGYNACCTPATAQGVTDAFNFNQLDNGLRGIEQGLCNGFYTTAGDIAALSAAMQNCCCQTQQSIASSTNTLNTAILQGGFQTQTSLNGLSAQVQSSTCELQRGQDAIQCAISNQTNQLLVAGDKNTDRIINYLTQSEMDRLRTELQTAQFQISQQAQTASIVNQLQPVPRPAYIVASPYNSYGYYNNGCGCACGL